ncbi:ZDH15 [Hepatospora eriocheir]|uniref:Palmitoyltransferase n=1 Tax=Hepatospora eriocheir TaxID=1081669 RepID=A0A1X0QJT3_9MICR|nr:ZDH15 [Hepatospora eriocheir]
MNYLICIMGRFYELYFYLNIHVCTYYLTFIVMIGVLGLTALDYFLPVKIILILFYILFNYCRLIYGLSISINLDLDKQKFVRKRSVDSKDDISQINDYIVENFTNMNKTNKICEYCKNKKQPRAHHCKKCQRCYLKYDHHDVFFNRCISFYNYKNYLQALVSEVVAYIYFIVVISVFLLLKSSTNRKYLFYLIVVILCLVLNFIEVWYFIYQTVVHMKLVAKNETTTESIALDTYIKGDCTYVSIFQEGPIKTFSSSKNRNILNPYNLGYSMNIKEVFGDNYMDFLSPEFTSKGNGQKFNLNC